MASFGVAAQAARLFAILANGQGSACILVVSDSTAAGNAQWPALVTDWLAHRHPRHDVWFRPWNYQSETYDPPQQRQVGAATGEGVPPPSLTVHNLSVGGKSTDYALGCIAQGVAAIQPDLIFVAHGLNEASRTVPPPDCDQYRAHYLALTETLAASAPQAGMILVLQNPETTSTVMSERNAEYTRVAQLRRCAVIDVHGAFLAHQDWQTELMRDARHPNADGQALWAGVVQRALDSAAVPAGSVFGRRASSLLERPGTQLLSHARVADWNDTFPPGWSVHNAVVSPGGRLGAVAADQAAYLQARITGEGLARIRGGRLTVSARVCVPQEDAAAASGLLEIDDHREEALPPGGSSGGGPRVQRSRVATLRIASFVWVCATAVVHPRSRAVSIRLYASVGGASAPAEVVVESVTAVPGLVPRNLVPRNLVPRNLASPPRMHRNWSDCVPSTQ